MRLIPGKTKVKIEIFRKVTLSDVIVGLIGLIAVTLCVVSSLPGRWIIAMFVLALFALMLFRLDDDPMYVFLWHMLRYKAYPKRFSRVFSDELMLKGRDFAVDMVFNGEGEKTVVNKGESDHVTPSELAAIIGGEEDDAAFYAALEEAKKGETLEGASEVTENSVHFGVIIVVCILAAPGIVLLHTIRFNTDGVSSPVIECSVCDQLI